MGTAAIVFDDLGGATVGRDDHTTDLVVLNGFNKLAVPHGADLGLAATAAPMNAGAITTIARTRRAVKPMLRQRLFKSRLGQMKEC